MGLLQLLSIAKGHWHRIEQDFITNLEVSGNGHDSIVICAYHMTSRADWQVCRKTIDALAFALIFIDDIVHQHAVAIALISDDDICFTADRWRDVVLILQTKMLLSTAFHPQLMATLITQTRWFYHIRSALPLTIKLIRTTTSHRWHILTMPQQTIQWNRCQLTRSWLLATFAAPGLNCWLSASAGQWISKNLTKTRMHWMIATHFGSRQRWAAWCSRWTDGWGYKTRTPSGPHHHYRCEDISRYQRSGLHINKCQTYEMESCVSTPWPIRDHPIMCEHHRSELPKWHNHLPHYECQQTQSWSHRHF